MPVDVAAIQRRPDGTFLTKPPGSGMAKDSKTRITRLMRHQFSEWYKSKGEDVNPLIVLAKVMLATKDDGLRIMAAAKLAKFYMPTRIELDIETDVDNEKIARLHAVRDAIQKAFADGSSKPRLLPAGPAAVEVIDA